MNTSTIPSHFYKGGADELETFVMENCLMLFKQQAAAAAASASRNAAYHVSDDVGRSYPCKTCGKKFHSFQALGGHRASHKKLKVDNNTTDVASTVAAKPKTHACTICGVEFPIGQALGGHMRRHRAVVSTAGSANVSTVTAEVSDGNNSVKKRKNEDVSDGEVMPVLKKSNSSKRVCLDFNLSFAPWIGKKEEEEEKAGGEVEGSEIVEQEGGDEDEDFLKLELRPPIRV
ncbi:uncharacterized protein LOC141622797 [Silene latifolia]|uniref:uncharacterized protein LOC141622797 n=1 Tax=Silene latifolia TaxID=37657 RepID=UPI003D772F61